MDALAFLDAKKLPEVYPVYVLYGDERFLQQAVLQRLKKLLLPGEADDFSLSQYDGDTTDLARVRDDLETIPFTSPRRLVIIDEADGFVSKYRKQLEKYQAHPSGTGVLILVVKSWPSNTSLAKKNPPNASMDCKALKDAQLKSWLVKWTSQHLAKKFSQDAASLLVDLIGTEMGILTQEAAKLASYVGERDTITTEDVDKLCGHSRGETTWRMLDALAEGSTPKALEILHHLLDQGEDPLAIMGAVSWQLRKLVQVARLMQQERESLAGGIARAGLPPFKRDSIGRHLQLLGPNVYKVFDWLLEVNLSLKSSDALPPVVLLERFLIRLGQPEKKVNV
jgi:DNA polymerase III subunit delta